MLMTILGAIVFIVAIILVIASTRPDTSTIERSAVIHAPAEKIFPHMNDFHAWGAWSPWEKMDPNLKRTFSGAEKGVGAKYDWEGNNQVGIGRMEILESVPHSKILIALDFLKPFEAHNRTEFTFTPANGGGTLLNWKMTGPQPFMFKLMGLFMNMQDMVGKDFEKGLASLKAIAES